MAKNKLKKFHEMEQFEHVFQCSYNDIAQGTIFVLKGCWRENFFHNTNPIVLELGCGKGEYTIEQAKCTPNKNFIGVDIKGARMWTGATEAKDANLSNVAFIRTDIHLLNHFFAENEINEIWITFPDPQMKKVRKRLTATTFLDIYRSVLTDNGTVHLKTDSSFLFQYTSELLKINSLPILYQILDLYKSDIQNITLTIKTYYERQWLARNISIKYLAFSLPKEIKLIEPKIDIPFDDYRSFGRNRRAELKI